jgi:hypothetical protein
LVPLDPPMLDVFRAHRQETGWIAGLVFASVDGTMLDRNNVRKRGHAAAAKAA